MKIYNMRSSRNVFTIVCNGSYTLVVRHDGNSFIISLFFGLSRRELL
jgi:hypothetical protein